MANKKRKAPPAAVVPPEDSDDDADEVEEPATKKKKGGKAKSEGKTVSADGSSGAEKPQAAFSKDQKKALEKEAITDILAGIAKPEMQNSRKAYIPPDWAKKYKAALGSYKTFVANHTKTFTVINHDSCNFTVRKAGTPEAEKGVVEAGKQTVSWHKELIKAWMEYCKATPKVERNFQEFIAEVPKNSANSPAVKPASSPSLKPASSPSTKPGAAPAASKKKKKGKAKASAD
eukprot:TRINITY_DN6732_c0_g1_i1.p1 TRINITY_DN6732_c0_g1~~TRINITY_DN6732_c0_g1_i1.p1  ORF type:complete len:248 (+),score=77.16 TRINITY_DN6732_c0_g1_i1:50-745(+)